MERTLTTHSTAADDSDASTACWRRQAPLQWARGMNLDDLKAFRRYAAELPRFLAEPLSAQRAIDGILDYQLVEEEQEGLPKVTIVVSPRVGEVDERAVVAAVLDGVSSGPTYHRMMAAFWRDGETLQVVRREPYATHSAKVLPLHLLRP